MSSLIVIGLLSFAVSFDSFFFGLTFEIRSISISSRIVIFIGMVTGASFLVGSWLGELFVYVMPRLTDYLGGTIFIGIGLWVIWQWISDQKKKLKTVQSPWSLIDLWHVLKEPQMADYDHSGSIHGYEAFLVAFALSMDSFATGIGSTFTELPIYILACLIGIFSSLFLLIGKWTGSLLQRIHSIHLLGFFPGMIFIGIGILNLIR